MTDVDTLPSPNQALWEKGDFTRIAATMRQSGEELVDGLAIESGMAVLDLGSGDGTTALPAARRGADVLAVDIASNLVAAGNERARQAGLYNLRFEQGDASNLAALADSNDGEFFGALTADERRRLDQLLRKIVRDRELTSVPVD